MGIPKDGENELAWYRQLYMDGQIDLDTYRQLRDEKQHKVVVILYEAKVKSGVTYERNILHKLEYTGEPLFIKMIQNSYEGMDYFWYFDGKMYWPKECEANINNGTITYWFKKD